MPSIVGWNVKPWLGVVYIYIHNIVCSSKNPLGDLRISTVWGVFATLTSVSVAHRLNGSAVYLPRNQRILVPSPAVACRFLLALNV